MTTTFVFDATTFVQNGHEQTDGEWSNKDLEEIADLREVFPELNHWGNLAIGSAWGSYSQDIMAVGWCYSSQSDKKHHHDEFLAYCYVSQLAPSFCFGGTGLHFDDVEVFGKQKPWLGNTHPIPEWATK